MEIIIDNTKTPRWAQQSMVAEFRLILRREGDKIVLSIPTPRTYRSWPNFTTAEKDAYNALVAHVIDTAPAAMRKAKGGAKCAAKLNNEQEDNNGK